MTTMTSQLKRWVAVAVTIALVGMLPGPADAVTRFWWTVVNELGRPYPQGTVTCQAYKIDGGAPEHLHSTLSLGGSGGPAEGNTSPLVGNSQGVFEFYKSAETPVDVICWSRAGNRARISKLTRFTHEIELSRLSLRKISRIPFHTNATTINTRIYMPVGALIRDVVIYNSNPSIGDDNIASPHIEVGFAGNHAVSGDVSGLVRPLVMERTVSGTDANWYFPTQTFTTANNARITMPHVGTALATVASSHVTSGQDRHYSPYLVHVIGGLEVTYRTSAATGMNGHIYVIWDDMHLGANAWGLDE